MHVSYCSFGVRVCLGMRFLFRENCVPCSFRPAFLPQQGSVLHLSVFFGCLRFRPWLTFDAVSSAFRPWFEPLRLHFLTLLNSTPTLLLYCILTVLRCVTR